MHTAETKKKISDNHADVSGHNHPMWGKENPEASKRFHGERNPKWKGGISALNILIRATKEYKQWRQQVYKRDSFICQNCNQIDSGNLNAHHVYLFADILHEENVQTIIQAKTCKRLWDIKNGVTLCKKCHKKEHFK